MPLVYMCDTGVAVGLQAVLADVALVLAGQPSHDESGQVEVKRAGPVLCRDAEHDDAVGGLQRILPQGALFSA